jgi:hypothetical protein
MGESEEREEVEVEKGGKRQVRDDEAEEDEESERQGQRKRTKTTPYVVLSDEGEEELDELESTLDESVKPAAVGMLGRGVTRGRGRGGKRVLGPFRAVSGKVSKYTCDNRKTLLMLSFPVRSLHSVERGMRI